MSRQLVTTKDEKGRPIKKEFLTYSGYYSGTTFKGEEYQANFEIGKYQKPKIVHNSNLTYNVRTGAPEGPEKILSGIETVFEIEVPKSKEAKKKLIDSILGEDNDPDNVLYYIRHLNESNYEQSRDNSFSYEEIAFDMLGLKISLAIAFMLLLIIPFLIKPINGLYDVNELKGLRAYCFLHADRAAQGENVVNDLIKSGLANSKYYDWSCSKISEEIEIESQKGLSFTYHCYYDILTPSQYSECHDAGHPPSANQFCFDGDGDRSDLSKVEPLTPAERLECENAGYEPEQREDKDTK